MAAELIWPSTHPEPPERWAEQQFHQARLGHCSRTKRLEQIAAAWARQPGRSLSELCPDWSDRKATYHLFARPEVTPEAEQRPHRRAVREALRQPGWFLLLEDTSFLSFSHRRRPVPGLGPIGDSGAGQQGFLLHSALAVAWPNPATAAAEAPNRPPVTVLGLADQQYLTRQPRPADEPDAASVRRKQRDRESQRWMQASHRIGPAPAGPATTWVRVADREADIYEYIQSCQDNNHRYVIRIMQDRTVLAPETDQPAGRSGARIQAAPAQDQRRLKLRSRPDQAAREARLQLSFGALRLRTPERPGQPAGSLPPIAASFVRVWEPDPPEGVQPLEWRLLTDLAVTDVSTAWSIVQMYAGRWIIEDYHQCLKTGLRAESLQLATADRLFAAIAVMAVVAVRLLVLRDGARQAPEAPASASGLSDHERALLSRKLNRPLTTTGEVLLALGRLGGHLNRRRDGWPGWQTLWRGWRDLQALVEGARLAGADPPPVDGSE